MFMVYLLNEILSKAIFSFISQLNENSVAKKKYQLTKWKVLAVNLSSGQTAMIWRTAVGGKVYRKDKVNTLEIEPAYIVHYKL